MQPSNDSREATILSGIPRASNHRSTDFRAQLSGFYTEQNHLHMTTAMFELSFTISLYNLTAGSFQEGGHATSHVTHTIDLTAWSDASGTMRGTPNVDHQGSDATWRTCGTGIFSRSGMMVYTVDHRSPAFLHILCIGPRRLSLARKTGNGIIAQGRADGAFKMITNALPQLVSPGRPHCWVGSESHIFTPLNGIT